VEKSLRNARISIAVVIPTRNREVLLNQILDDLSSQSVKPNIVVVVDSSDEVLNINRQNLNFVVLSSVIRSAAIQRNLGLAYLDSLDSDFDLCAFLDDDVRIEEDYLEKLSRTLIDTHGAIGISGLAIGDDESHIRRNRFLDSIGFTGAEGKLTCGAINVPVRTAKKVTKVDWLIGCSLWKLDSLGAIRFQEDFMGQSIFEDVLFSVEAGKFGNLIVDPQVRFRHLLATENRPNLFEHYYSWVKNRYRLKRIAPQNFSTVKFLLVNFLVAGKLFIHLRIKGVLGITLALLQIGLKR